jgi:GMP synthase (glutamine-hydrolysing)
MLASPDAHRPVLVLIHAPWETPALIEVALGNTIPTVRRTIFDQASPDLPKPSELGGLVVMGGPQDANADSDHPGLPAERRLLAEAVSAEVPVLGICLGMQLLAVALGARLHLRHGKEVGFAPVDITDRGLQDPAFIPLVEGLAPGARLTFLHWHTDAVDLPTGATLLASTSTTPVQAFRMGSALGTQFHPEADTALLDRWLSTAAMIEGLAPELVMRTRQEGQSLLPSRRAAALSGLADFVASVRKRRGH